MRYHLAIPAVVFLLVVAPACAQHLPGTEPLTQKADFAKVMVEGIDRWLDREIAGLDKVRDKRAAAEPLPIKGDRLALKRERLKRLLGVVDRRVGKIEFEYVAAPGRPALVAETKHFKAYAVRWPVLPGVTGEGLLLEPNEPIGTHVRAIAIPDAEITPEQIAGLAKGLDPSQQFARHLAERGSRVVIPTLVDRKSEWSGNPAIGRQTNQAHREFLWRMSFEMGRHVLGYEMQRVLALVDLLDRDRGTTKLYGYGEGGHIALACAAIDERLAATTVSGYFNKRHKIHEEPIDRDVWNRLREFGDAELAQMVAPRRLIVENSYPWPSASPMTRPGRSPASPGAIGPIDFAEALAEARKAGQIGGRDIVVANGLRKLDVGAKDWRDSKGRGLGWSHLDRENGGQHAPEHFEELAKTMNHKTPPLHEVQNDPTARQKRQFDELVNYTQKLLPEAARKRQEHVWDKLDTKTLDGFKKSQEPLRESFWTDIVGKMPEPLKNMKPRTRLILETPKWKGYEVVLDLYEEVICYGILLVPSDIMPGEKRPCVVCQHGLEGRPMDVVDPTKKTTYYNSFGAQLADRGYVVFAPQAPYIFENQFRQLVRKMHPLGLNLYAVIVRQHEQILAFLNELPFVDGSRIAYYGLSYGGKVAMRIPSILLGYCAVICSGDFNDWIWKNITLDWGGSYMFTREYDMYEFNLGNTFSYAEMAALIAPRPFMVERGHDDGVGLDEYVAFEYAKVRRLYSRLGISDRTEIEFFPGGHEIRGVGTFAFLRKHLNWPPADAPRGTP